MSTMAEEMEYFISLMMGRPLRPWERGALRNEYSRPQGQECYTPRDGECTTHGKRVVDRGRCKEGT
jgi:hypothetical protein